MGYLKRTKVITHFLKHGGTLEFEHKKTKSKATFEITKQDFKVINKMLKWKSKHYLLMNNKHNLTLHKSLEDIAKILEKPYVELEELYYQDSIYVILNRDTMLAYIDSVNIKASPKTYFEPETKIREAQDKTKQKPSESPKKPARFDWHDHFLEGMRIHRDIDDAEAHADAMKAKHDKAL